MVSAPRDSSRRASKMNKRRTILIRRGLPGKEEFLSTGVASFLHTAAIIQPLSGKHRLECLPSNEEQADLRAGVASKSISVRACRVFPRRESRCAGGFRARGAGRW